MSLNCGPPTGLLFSPEMIYEYREPRWNDIGRVKPKNSEINRTHFHFIQQKIHMDWPGCEPGTSGYGTALPVTCTPMLLFIDIVSALQNTSLRNEKVTCRRQTSYSLEVTSPIGTDFKLSSYRNILASPKVLNGSECWTVNRTTKVELKPLAWN
jgi:hypothetical protein